MTYVTHSLTATEKVVVLSCIAWPFVSLAILRRGGRSSAPLAAMLVPLAVSVAGTWLFLVHVMRSMPIGGGGRASTAAGIAQALALLVIGAGSAFFVGVAALIRRHTAVGDRLVVLIAACYLADVAAAVLFAGSLAPHTEQTAYTGAAVSVAIAAGAAIWLLLVARGRVTPRPIPYAVTAIVAACAVAVFFVWQHAQSYIEIAMHG